MLFVGTVASWEVYILCCKTMQPKLSLKVTLIDVHSKLLKDKDLYLQDFLSDKLFHSYWFHSICLYLYILPLCCRKDRTFMRKLSMSTCPRYFVARVFVHVIFHNVQYDMNLLHINEKSQKHN